MKLLMTVKMTLVATQSCIVCLLAEKLINPAFSFSGEGFLKRSSSNTSLNSIVSIDGEQHMRICTICRQLLERRDSMAELRNTKPPIVQLYEVGQACQLGFYGITIETVSLVVDLLVSLSEGVYSFCNEGGSVLLILQT